MGPNWQRQAQLCASERTGNAVLKGGNPSLTRLFGFGATQEARFEGRKPEFFATFALQAKNPRETQLSAPKTMFPKPSGTQKAERIGFPPPKQQPEGPQRSTKATFGPKAIAKH